ncbi:MAG: tRNA (N(6)-L-threonylcarbamoyladenosine(37)-C(2))-methylthiotransferase MtaB [Deltaproteobacteria bacterium]|nr:tRNA (N(6)-L-threonylcarbamoyladenosine(37)-C(2))-methylthiotransferase MtaB [Deltaproteobacteria bacterium]TLN02421.1 MAG: tRNA (N(6)-L-threonylcarbamoyladenosine(37)-C(2))-methylthiotransferase MtaB [bacterium]
MKKISFVTLGCKTNQFESAAMTEAARKEGYLVVSAGEAADICVINTCTVTARTDAESRRLIRKALRENPAARIVVTGCYAQIAAEEISDLPGVALIIGNTEKRELLQLLRNLGEEQQIKVTDISNVQGSGPLLLETFAEHTRAFLQVQNGCDSRCSYCIVPHVRGPSRSVSLDDALEGIRTFARQGFQEVVLTGIHLGAFGLDLTPPTSLLELLSRAEQEKIVPRLRLGSLEPTEISTELIELIARGQTICPHLHIPLQSGDDGVLAAMNRPYTSGFFRELVDQLTTAAPDLCLGTDIIAGFPGETDEAFARGYRILEDLPLAYFHVFPFSPRQGTPAATMPDPVPPAVIKKRAEALRDLSLRKKRAYFEKFLGRELLVLIQQNRKGRSLQGLSRNYLSVAIPGHTAPVNTEVKVRITGTDKDQLIGVAVL